MENKSSKSSKGYWKSQEREGICSTDGVVRVCFNDKVILKQRQKGSEEASQPCGYLEEECIR